MNVPIDLEKDVIYAGNTEEEKRLNKELLETILELNAYQDAYDKMLSVDKIKPEVEKLKKLLHEEYIPKKDYYTYIGSLKALEWVLNGSETQEEKLARLPRASKEDVAKIIKGFNEKYKQMSLEDYGIDLGGKKDE